MPLHVAGIAVLIMKRSNCIIQHLVSSHPIKWPPTEGDDTRCYAIQFNLLMMSTTVLETCRGI